MPRYSEARWKSYIAETTKPVLTPQQCDELIRIGQSEPKTEGKTSQKEGTHGYRKSIISWIPIDKAAPIYQIIKRWMETTNANHFGFDTVQLTETGQYTEYSKGGFYKWHMDSGVEMSDMPPVRKISMTLLLNDPKEFEGGELEIYNGELTNTGSKEHLIKLRQGQAIFFASFFLHRVNTVTEGNRKALVMWFGGTSFK